MPITERPAFEHSATVPVGDVIRQVPETVDEVLYPDTVITVYYSLGPGSWFESTANADESIKTRYAMFLAVRMDFPSDTLRVWSGFGQITLFGEVYTGIGLLGRVSSTPERTNLTFEKKTYQLAGAGVDPALVTEEDIEGSFGRTVIEYLGFLSEQGVLIADPEKNFEGEISNIQRKDGREPSITVNAENRLVMLDRVDGWRYTHQHQQQFYDVVPVDQGFDQVKSIATREVFWGGDRVAGGPYGGGRPYPSRRIN